MKLIKFLLKIAPFLYMVLIWVLSSHPADALVTFSVADSMIKESLHLIEFAILYALLVFFFLVDGKLTKKTSLFAAVFSGLYGLVDEIHQYFVPYRSATVIDVVKDVIGVVVVYWIVNRTYFKAESKFGHWMRKVERGFVKED